MRGTRIYPDEPTRGFPVPPAVVEDREGRTIELLTVDDGADGDRERSADDDLEDLVRMYVVFDPADRAQGIPPTGEAQIRRWLEPLFDCGVNVLARHDGEVVGHATLVPDTDDPGAVDELGAVEWELAIFVLQAYQRAGIGTELLEHLLGHASERGIERVWLTVERWNGPAIALYERVGFEICGAESFEQEMSIRLE